MKSIEFVIPVYNEERRIERGIIMLYSYLSKHVKNNWKITIADNASTDHTPEIVKDLSRRMNKLDYVRLHKKGKGRAIQKTWMESEFDYVAFMDADMSTDLKHIAQLIEWLDNGYDLVIGNRFMKRARIKRGFFREMLSEGYNLLLRIMMWTKITDSACGFKAARTESIKRILHLIKDKTWFFDTEMVLLAEKKKLKIKQIAVHWEEAEDSKVNVIKVTWMYLENMIRMRFRFWFSRL